jgi:sulfur carrier protein
MILVINGQEREFPQLNSDAPLSALVDVLELKGDRVAIERNGLIVPRGAWVATALQERDKLEVVHFVGGGFD